MLYRFSSATTAGEIAAGQAVVTSGLPPEALLGSQSYLTVKEKITSDSEGFVPFLIVFGILGVALAVLIVGNVVSGAVVSGVRHIGVLKALGFTPNQVMAVYLTMVAVPSLVGCVLGTIAGHLIAQPILADTFQAFGGDVGVPAWADVVGLLGLPALVALAALLSALRARRLSAVEAISAGSAPRVGRALTVQHWLGGTWLPRSVSLGLGVPFARPARSGLTLAAIVLGVMTVTLAIGVALSVDAYGTAVRPADPDRIEVRAGRLEDPVLPDAPVALTEPELSDAEDEALLRSLPGAEDVVAVASPEVEVVGGTQGATVMFYRGDGASLGPRVLHGRWPADAEQVAASSRFLNQRRLALGDTITLELDGNRTRVEIVGVVLINNEDTLVADWATLATLAPGRRADSYLVQFRPGLDRSAVEDAVAAGDAGLEVLPPRDTTSDTAVGLIGSASLLTLVLGVVAALGVFNTVVLNAHERRRDLGMLKSIGMTPRQVTVMMVTSMGALGVVGGLLGVPLGVAAHQVVAPAMLRAAHSEVFDFVLDVYRAPMLVALGLAGVAIALLGALLPARSAARTPIAAVLHNE
jgi:putative ABC transport system permease protein